MLNALNANTNTLWQPVGKNAKTKNQNFSPMQDIVLKGDALVSGATRLPGGGILNAHAFKADSSTPENPVILVKGTNTCGTPFEVEININQLNKNNLSFIELFALDGYKTYNTGRTSTIAREAANALFIAQITGQSEISADGFTSFNILNVLKESLALHKQNRNWDAVVSIDYIINSFTNHFARRV